MPVGINQLTVGLALDNQFAPVLWTEGQYTPYTIKESGITDTVNITVYCYVYAGLPPAATQCLDFGPSSYFDWSSLTPSVRWRQANIADQCIVYPRGAVDYRLEFPTSFQFEAGKYYYFLLGYHHGFSVTGIPWRLLPAPFSSVFGNIKTFPETCIPIGTGIIYHNHFYYINGLNIREAVFWTELVYGYANPPG